MVFIKLRKSYPFGLRHPKPSLADADHGQVFVEVRPVQAGAVAAGRPFTGVSAAGGNRPML